jgi:hypothetical protein
VSGEIGTDGGLGRDRGCAVAGFGVPCPSLPVPMDGIRTMQLHFERFDGRSFNSVDVIDRDSGEKVGLICSNGVGRYRGGISVELFDGKYRAQLKRYDECLGFVRGVEAVLNHMLPAKKKKPRPKLMVMPLKVMPPNPQ